MATVMQPVQFHGDTIYCVTFQSQPYTSMRPIVENLGLDWKTQTRKLNANKERWGVVIMTTPSKGGDQETLCMPVRKLPAFMASINPKKVRPELREKIELYQNECDDALWDYWTKGRAERKKYPGLSPEGLTLSTPADREPLRRIVDAWSRLTGKASVVLWSRITSRFGVAHPHELPLAWIPAAISIAQNCLDGACPAKKKETSSLELPVVDDKAYQSGKLIFDDLNKIASLAKNLEIAIPIVANPGGRKMILSPEKEALYASAGSHISCLLNSIRAAYASAAAIFRMKNSVDF